VNDSEVKLQQLDNDYARFIAKNKHVLLTSFRQLVKTRSRRRRYLFDSNTQI